MRGLVEGTGKNVFLHSRWRQAVLDEARTWIGTPWLHRGCRKGEAVDCGQFVYACFLAAGVVPRLEVAAYTPQWAAHRDDERLLDFARGLGFVEIDRPQEADVVLWKVGRAYSHAAIVLDWPLVIHANGKCRYVMIDEADNCAYAQRDKVFMGLKPPG